MNTTNMHRAVPCLLRTATAICVVLLAEAGLAAETTGEVTDVRGQELLLRFAPGTMVRAGDMVEVYTEIPGVGEATVGSALVGGTSGDMVVASVQQATGQIRAGQKVRIKPAATAPVANPPASSPADPRDRRFPPWPSIKPNQPWIGESRWWANRRMTVLCGVLKDGPAGKAGLQADDTILGVAGKKINDNGELQKAIEEHQPGETIDFEIERDGQRRIVPVTLEAIPPDGGNGRILTAAEAGESWAMMDIGVRYANLRGNVSYFEENDAEAIRWFRRSIEAGYAAGPWFLGIMYELGKGVPKDFAEAARLYEQARIGAGEGVHKGLFEAATLQLAGLYLSGLGVPKDPAKGAQLLREAADRGNLTAMHRLGGLYESGIGVPQSYDQAMEFYQLAANEKYGPAEYAIGAMAYYGNGVKRNFDTARAWFELAAGHGSSDAMNKLGRMYAEGSGAPNDDAQAAGWFRRAADKGLAAAQDYLAYLYAEGRGVPKDLDAAIGWYRKAAAQGDTHALESLKKLGVPMTTEKSAAPTPNSAAPPAARATLDFLWIRVPDGAMLWGVLPDGPAAQAGLRYGDIVTRIDGVPPTTTLTNDNAGPLGVLADHRPGDRVVVEYLRDGQPQTMDLVLVAYPDDHGLARLTPIAEKGEWWAVHAVGVVHYMTAQRTTGAEAEHEYAQALPWFLKASAADFTWSHLLLGHMYARGNGVPQNEAEAIAHYEEARRTAKDRLDRLAADIAATSLGRRAMKQSPPDDQAALALFREAADDGSADGQYLMGWMYEKGRGVAADRDEAIRWYQKAADQGHADAGKSLQSLQGPNEADGLARAGEEARLKQDWRTMLETYRQVVRLRPNTALYWNELGTAYWETGDYENCADAHRHAVELEPQSGRFHANFAGVLWRLGQMDDARKEAESAASLGFRDHWVFDKLGL